MDKGNKDGGFHIVKRKSKGHLPRNKSMSPTLKQIQWVPNAFVDRCYHCNSGFNMLTNRKHHCRHCGNIFCDKCSSYKISLPERGMLEPVRVCISCYNEVYYKQMMHGALIDGDDIKDGAPQRPKREQLSELLHAEFAEHNITLQPGEDMKMHLPQTYFYAQEVSRVADVDNIPRIGDQPIGAASPQTAPELPSDQAPLWCGTLVVTNYRLCYLPSRGARIKPSGLGIQAMAVRFDILLSLARCVDRKPCWKVHVCFMVLILVLFYRCVIGSAVNDLQS